MTKVITILMFVSVRPDKYYGGHEVIIKFALNVKEIVFRGVPNIATANRIRKAVCDNKVPMKPGIPTLEEVESLKERAIWNLDNLLFDLHIERSSDELGYIICR